MLSKTHSFVRTANGFASILSPNPSDRVIIPASFQIITNENSLLWANAEVINFAPDSQIREICGFNEFRHLHRLEIPTTADILKGFTCCCFLSELIFPTDSHLQKIVGFDLCRSLSRIEFPSSTKHIEGFSSC
jgi:hypothetical protein